MPKIAEMIGKKEKSFKQDGSRWPELIGIEFELENVQDVRGLPYWEVKADNSLRNGVEYVLDAPYGGPTLEAALDSFYGAKLRCDNSVRTSTHVHLNVLDTDFEAVRTMIMIVYMIEDALFNVVEGERKWAGYSMPMSEMNTERLRTVLSAPWPDYGNKILSALAPTKNQERYYGFNFAATRRYGTVEFRYFPGGPTREEMESWLDLIVAIKKASLDIGTPQALIDRLNGPENVVEFLDAFLPPSWSNALLKNATSESMIEKFNEIAALCTEFVLDRRDPMMFITPSLMKFIGAKVLTKEGLTYLEKLRPLGVMTADEWDYHYSKAVRLERGQKHEDEEMDMVKAAINTVRTRPAGGTIGWDNAVFENNTFERRVVAEDPAPTAPPRYTFPPPQPAARTGETRTQTKIRLIESDLATLARMIEDARRLGNDNYVQQYQAMEVRKRAELNRLRLNNI